MASEGTGTLQHRLLLSLTELLFHSGEEVIAVCRKDLASGGAKATGKNNWSGMKSVPQKCHAPPPEPRNVNLCGNTVFADVIS